MAKKKSKEIGIVLARRGFARRPFQVPLNICTKLINKLHFDVGFSLHVGTAAMSAGFFPYAGNIGSAPLL